MPLKPSELDKLSRVRAMVNQPRPRKHPPMSGGPGRPVWQWVGVALLAAAVIGLVLWHQ